MAKKYVPSGYQIINIDASDKTSGTPFTPETEDEKLLLKYLKSDKIEKPLLLHCISISGVTSNGFVNIIDGAISFSSYDGTNVVITYDDVKLQVIES